MSAGARTADWVRAAARRWPDRTALSDESRRWSFAELDAWVDALADGLARQGLRRGDVLPIIVDPDAEGIATLWAVRRAGATVAPLNPRLTAAERDDALTTLAEADAPVAPRAPPPLAVLWTSGTSGRPRGVALSAEALRIHALAVARRLGLHEGDRWLASLSVAHVGGLALVTRAALLGSEVVATGGFEAEAASQLMDRGRVTHMSLVPTQFMRLLEHRAGAPLPPTFRCVLIGGAHAPDALVRRALGAGWPVALTYGMTEACSQVATAPPDVVRARRESAGKPLDGVEVRTSDDGEILVRGPTLAIGYVGSDEPMTDEEGWYHTGDLGSLDDDGFLRVTGRRADRIVSGGVTVDAREVEAALEAHPAVVEACVVGVPDAEWGERVGAVVVGVEGEVTPDELASFLEERLMSAKRPRVWKFVDGLPRNANGKINRVEVRGMLVS